MNRLLIFNRVLRFVFTGAFCIGCVAALEAYLSFVGHAAMMSVFAPKAQVSAPASCISAGLAFFIPFVVSLVGGTVGAIAGAAAFGFAGVASYRHRHADSLLGPVSKQATLGSLLGWVFGGALGTASSALWLAITKSSAFPVEEGFVWGLVVGSALGVFGGALRAIQHQTTSARENYR